MSTNQNFRTCRDDEFGVGIGVVIIRDGGLGAVVSNLFNALGVSVVDAEGGVRMEELLKRIVVDPRVVCRKPVIRERE